MTQALFTRVVLTRDLDDEALRAGDVGVVVEHYPASDTTPEGYEIEFFSATGDTLRVVSVPATAVRQARPREVLSARELAKV